MTTHDGTTAQAAKARSALRRCRRLVVKIGSAALAGGTRPFDKLADELSAVLAAKRRSAVVVSSGAIMLGLERLGIGRPRKMARLQAAAAAGQSQLMERYAEAFGRHDMRVAQVLLSHADLASRQRVNNARGALTELLSMGVVPIINENDAVAVDEIRFGDNDELAAMVTPLVDGDLLMLLSSVPGLLADRRRVPLVTSIDADLNQLVKDDRSGPGRGGMASKLEAARRATLAGAHVVIADAAEDQIIARVLAGDDVGTLFVAQPRMSGRKHWIAYTLRPRGVAVVDDGAHRAVRAGGSLLAVGVVGVRGRFVPGDAIRIETLAGQEVARGLAKLGAADAARLARGGDSGDARAVLVHRDDLVLFGRDAAD